MALIQGRRVSSGGAPRTGGPPPVARYAAQAMWPGITAGYAARCWGCTWAMRNGVYEVKFRHSMCWVHRRTA